MDISKYPCTFSHLGNEKQALDTVRALHETVVSLRSALKKAQCEVERLKSQSQEHISSAVSKEGDISSGTPLQNCGQKFVENNESDFVEGTENALSAEPGGNLYMDTSNSTKEEGKNGRDAKQDEEIIRADEIIEEEPEEDENEEDDLSNVAEKAGESASEETEVKEPVAPREGICKPTTLNIEVVKPDTEGNEKTKVNQVNTNSFKTEQTSDDESEELDDIELIFTTDDTKDLQSLHENLVSISEGENWQAGGTPVLLKYREISEFDESFEDDEDPATKKENLSKGWKSSVSVTTDISKCGDYENMEQRNVARRNTLPSQVRYKPVICKEPGGVTRSQASGNLSSNIQSPPMVKFTPINAQPLSKEWRRFPVRPILVERTSPKRESCAQTDITALPSHWRSESYLAHKVSHNFTTLPSKFSIPVQQQSQRRQSIKLSAKTQEARRTLLSDINFTSMVPELSRSADYLCQEDEENNPNACQGIYKNYPRAHSYMQNTESPMKSYDTIGESLTSPGFSYSRIYGKGPWSPALHSSSGYMKTSLSQYGSHCKPSSLDCCNRYCRKRASWSAISSPTGYDYVDSKQRHSFKSMPPSPDSYRHKATWSSVPSSPTHHHHHHHLSTRHFIYSPSELDMNSESRNFFGTSDPRLMFPAKSDKTRSRHRTKNRVTFQESSSYTGQSLPDLRAEDSGDSTDSLIDEAEEYLRRSIDSILTGADWTRVCQRRQRRRHSDPDPVREFRPPKSAQPFLPKVPTDLKHDYFVKVISSEGRVLVGRVRYVGNVPGRSEPHVGVELPDDSGNSDGTFEGRLFFDCEANKAIFVSFKKVVMAWTT